MAAQEVSRNNSTRHCVFAIDSEDDLRILPTSKKSGIESLSLSTPCRQGSMARTTDGKYYTLDGNDQWNRTSGGGGSTGGTGGGSGEAEDVEPISSTTIESLFG